MLQCTQLDDKNIQISYIENKTTIGELMVTSCDEDNVINLNGLVIKEEHRNKGIGSLLIQTAVNMFDNKNLELGVAISNKIAIKLYERHDFTVDSIFLENSVEMYRMTRSAQ